MKTLYALNFIANALEFLYEAGDCFAEHFISLSVLIYVAGESTGRFWYEWHGDWVGTIDWSLPEAPRAYVKPSVNPLMGIASELEQFTCKQLRAMSGCRLKTRKSVLVAAIIAG